MVQKKKSTEKAKEVSAEKISEEPKHHENKETHNNHKETEEKKEEKQEIRLTEEQKKQIEGIKTELDTFQSRLLEKFDKYIIGLSLLPPKKEEPDKVNIFVLVDDSDSKKMTKQELKEKLGTIIESVGKEINKNFETNTVILSELWESCYDGKSELMDIISKSAILFDRGILAAVKIGEVHKKMVLSKFEKYIVAYVLFGSLTRGEATEKSDIDVALIIDDTDVKRMTRAELKDKLRAIIIGMGFDAGEMTGIKNKLNIQVYILTDFWESVRDANPVIFTVLRDGIPFYDRGIFMPWKQLLKMGKIKPSQESIDMFVSTGDEIIKRIRDKIKNLVESDIYWATLTPSQAALMVYGVPPPTPKETIKLMEDIFVDKEKLLEPEFVDILKNNRKHYKDIEHGDLKEITGAQVDKLLNDSERYLQRIKKLFEQLYELKEKESLTHIKDNILTITRDLLKTQDIEKVKDSEMDKLFHENLVETGIVPNRYHSILKKILEKIHDREKLTKNEMNSLKKESEEYLKFIIETIQRIRIRNIESSKVRIHHAKKTGEIFFFEKDVFVIRDIEDRNDIQKGKLESNMISDLKKSSYEDLEKHVDSIRRVERPKLNEKMIESIRGIFGDGFEIVIN